VTRRSWGPGVGVGMVFSLRLLVCGVSGCGDIRGWKGLGKLTGSKLVPVSLRPFQLLLIWAFC
jgi:hypothetical protein